MAGTVENVNIRFNITGTEGLGQVSSKLNSIGSGISNLGSSISGLGMKISGAVTAPIAGIAAFGVKYNMTMQDLQTSFKVMLGSEEEAIKMTDKLNKMGAETPFESTQLAEYTKTMLAFGYTSENVLPVMSRLGDISLGNNEKMSSMTRTMGQINALGKLQGGDLNQLIGQGWNPLNAIMKKTGETTEQIRKRMSDGKIAYKEVEEALIADTSAGGQFYKGMEEGSKTLSGQLSTLKDNFSMLAGEITKPIFDGIAKILPKVINFVSGLQEKFSNLSPKIKTTILVAGGIVASIGPMLVVVGTLVGVIGGAIAGIGAIAGALAGLSPVISAVVAALPAMFVHLAAIASIFITIGAVIGYFMQKTGALAGILDILKMVFADVKVYAIDLAQNAFEKLKMAISFVKGVIDDVAKVAKPFIQETLKQAKPIIAEILSELYELGRALLDSLGEKIKQAKVVWDAIWPTLKPVVEVIFGVIKTVVLTALNVIKNIIKVVTSIIKGDWGAVWEGIKKVGSIIWEGIKTIAGTIFSAISKVIKNKIQDAKDGVSNVLNKIKSKFSDIFNGIKGIVDKVMGSITKTINNVGDKINWFKDKASGIGSKFIPGFADGTSYAPGGLALVGEKGPELVNLPRGSQVFNSQQTNRMMSNRQESYSKFDIDININSNNKVNSSLNNQIKEVVRDTLANNMNRIKR